MISGIRAIIAAMLQSFNPEQLEEQAKQNGMTSRPALPGSRKAALWDYFVRSYGETAGEIEDDFHTLFGEAFLHAYDMEVNQYKDSQSGSEENEYRNGFSPARTRASNRDQTEKPSGNVQPALSSVTASRACRAARWPLSWPATALFPALTATST